MRQRMLILGSIAASITLVLVVSLVVYFKNRINEYVLEKHDFYQYLSGTKYEYSGNLKLSNSNDITELLFDDVTVTLDSTPLYYKDEEKIILPKTMSIIFPLSNILQYKVNYFSSISKEEDSYYLIDGDRKETLSNCFLYDGNDLYFFIDETKIVIGDQEIVVSPLSYVILTYNDNIQIYNYSTDQMQTILIGENQAFAISGNYNINLSIDAVVYNNNSRLLIKNTSYLQRF